MTRSLQSRVGRRHAGVIGASHGGGNIATMRIARHLLWLPALLATSADALAWGLQTHVYFAQALLWLVPLADPRFAVAARRLPRLVLAGACLPDLSLVGALAGTRAFNWTHDWETAARLLGSAGCEEERALALGFASHLLTDIYAHHHFVPAHEAAWGEVPLVTHALSEWAMDCHVAGQLFAQPAQLLSAVRHDVAGYLADSFGCTVPEALTSVNTLGTAVHLLRRSGVPELARGVGTLADRRMARRFAHYLAHTTRQLRQINRIAAGERPRWLANPQRHQAREALAGMPRRLVRSRPPLPADVFAAG